MCIRDRTEDETEDNSVDGAAHIIPRDKLDDSSDWMAIAQTGGYYLIVRVNALRNDIPSSPYMSSGDYDYATSNIKSKIETWYNGTTTGTLAGLKSFAVRSDADVTVGQYGNAVSYTHLYRSFACVYCVRQEASGRIQSQRAE